MKQPATSPIPRTLQLEFVRELKKLSDSARDRVEFILTTSSKIDDNIIAEIQKVLEQELGPEQARKFVERYTPIFWERGALFAERQLKRYGLEIRIPAQLIGVVDLETLKQLQNLQLDLVKSLTEEQKKAVARIVREGILNGKSNKEIVDDILEVVDDAKWKIERIVRTETTRIFNLAAFDRYNKAGIKKYRWLTAADERTCPVCMSKHGKIFTKITELPPHSSHPNCRCTIVPYLEKEEEEQIEITGDKELDESIYKAISEYEKILKEEDNFLRALSRFIYGRAFSLDEVIEIGKEGKEFAKYFEGGDQEVRYFIQHLFPFRINPKIVERAGKVTITQKKLPPLVEGLYYWDKRKIIIASDCSDPGRVLLHEYGHHLHHYVYAEKIRKFFTARVRKHGYKLEPLNVHDAYAEVPADMYHFDGFDHVDPYAGCFTLGNYEDTHHERLIKLIKNPKLIETEEMQKELAPEMFSKALEYFRREQSMRQLWEKDRELFGFTLLLLRGDLLK